MEMKVVTQEANGWSFGSATIGLVAGSLGTALASPFNYARSMHYSSPPGVKPPSIGASIRKLLEDAKGAQGESSSKSVAVLKRISYLQGRLRIGWGTLRVGLGMSIGQLLYDKLVNEYF